MKNNRLISTAVGLGGLLACGAISQTMHPGYTQAAVTFSPAASFCCGTTSNPNNNNPLVGGMDVFPDGRVVVAEWGVPASVYILSGLQGGNTDIQVTEFAKGLDNVMGLRIVNGVIYVMEKEGLTQLLDTDNDGIADEYNSINEDFSSNNSMLNFPYDLGYLNGSFYAAMSSDVHTGGMDWGSSSWPNTPALSGRSTMYKLNLDGTSQKWAGGFRNPNGMGTNGNDIFVSENEGSWTPSSKVINVRQGRFYGHRTVPPETLQTANTVGSTVNESPPVVWGTWEISGTAGYAANHFTGRSWGNPIVLRHGPYRGHMLVPDLVNSEPNKVVRIFVENVGGELQGVIFPFVKNYVTAGIHRIQEAPDGSLYLGMLGSTGGWGSRSGMQKGFHVLRPNSTVPFEVLAMRSKGQGVFELEFTKPVGAAAAQASSYTVTSWRQVPVETYGGGRNTSRAALTVASATVSGDNMRVTLQINGMPTAAELVSQPGRVVKVAFATALTAQDNSVLFTHFAAYTLNQYGPGTDYQVVSVQPGTSRTTQAGWKLTAGSGYHVLNFLWNDQKPRHVAVYDVRGGKRLEMRNVSGASVRLETAGLGKGLYFVRVTDAATGLQGAVGATAQPLMIQ
jgi:hypothetical protein